MPCVLLAAVLIAGLLTPASVAHADGAATAPPDSVILKDGSKLRGTVIEEDPKRGVTILLLDGTTRQVVAANLDRVDFAPAAPLPSAAPPVVVPIAPPPVVYAGSTPPPPVVVTHRSTGAVVAGAVMAGAGAILVVGGGIYYASASKGTSNTVYACFNVSDCRNVTQTSHDSSGETTAAGLIVAGAVLMVGGLIAILVGSRHHTSARAAWLPAGTPHLALGETSAPVFLTPSPGGLALHF